MVGEKGDFMNFSIISAIDSKHGIGKAGGLPWRLKGDMAHFKQITAEARPGLKNAVIMGRATWESLPSAFKPLPDRINVVLSRSAINTGQSSVLTATSLSNALEQLQSLPVDKAFVIGGGQVYAQAILHPNCTKLYLTEVEGDFNCEIFFSAIPANFSKISESAPVTENGITYRFAEYERV